MSILDQLWKLIDKGKRGESIGRSTGMPKLDKIIGGIQPHRYYLVSAASSVGKTSYILYIIYNLLKQESEEAPIYFLYFSLEIGADILLAKLMGLYCAEEFGIYLTIDDILSFQTPIDDNSYKCLEKAKEWLDGILKYLIILDISVSASSLYKNTLAFAEKIGTYKQVGTTKVYIPNNPKQLMIGVLDHFSLVRCENGRTLKQEIDEKKEEAIIEQSLRPRTFDEYVGQSKVKDNLKVYISAALSRGQALDHVLLYGPPGLGKTTLAQIIASEMGVNIKVTSGPAITKVGDLAAILTNLEENDLLFIDEIHRLNKSVEEVLYPAMEDSSLDIIIGKGPSARSIRLDLPKFTLVGATTRAGNLSSPLRDRFGIIHRLEMYSPEDLSKIVSRSAGILNMEIDEEASLEIASRSRGTPRIANRLLKRVRDYAQYENKSKIDLEIAMKALSKLEIDELGLDETDRRMLSTMINNFSGGPVGLETLAASIGEDKDTIEDMYEPYLMQIGFIARTPKGRIATKLAYDHLDIEFGGN